MAAAEADAAGRCRVCGAAVEPGAAFCEECGAPQHGMHCEACGAAVKPGMALCPVCGRPVTTKCTFCGSPMDAGQAFCGECGNARSGIVCPDCGTLNFRSFCRKCNRPLNAMALEALEEARRDPHFIQAQKIADEMAEIEDEIARLEAEIASPQRVLEVDDSMSAATRRLLDEFNSLAGHAASPVPSQPKAMTEPRRKAAPTLSAAEPAKRTATKGPTASNARGPGDFGPVDRLEQLRQLHRAQAAALQRRLDAMVPEQAAPPEMKRNFACARMVTTVSKTTRKRVVRTGWVCHRCNVWHKMPSECAFEEYGGTWQTDVVTETVSTVSTGMINL